MGYQVALWEHAGGTPALPVRLVTGREYTVIGDMVNLASRIEKLNKEFGSNLLVSEAVWKSAFSEHLRDATPKGRAVRGRVIHPGVPAARYQITYKSLPSAYGNIFRHHGQSWSTSWPHRSRGGISTRSMSEGARSGAVVSLPDMMMIELATKIGR